MNDLISRQAAIDEIYMLFRESDFIHYNHGIADSLATLHNMPPAQQEQTAEWVPSTKYKGFLTCSACEDCYIETWSDKERKWRYCPQCGKRMK